MRVNSLALALASVALSTAQTFTSCNPTNVTCPNNPAIAASFETDFKAGASAVKGWKQTAGSLTYNSEGALFTINKRGDAPTIQTEGYVFFGYIEAKVKSAPGTGIISSIVLESDDLDEVDWEFLGGVTTNVQMNYFGKGNTTTYDREINGAVSGNTQTELHTYALNWTSASLTWLIDGVAVRTLNYADAVGGKNFPQTPSTVRIGIWAGGDEANSPGTISWAGGKTDYSKAPFTMTLDSVKIINNNPGTEYKWTDKSGSYQSIEVVGKGDTTGSPVNSAVLSGSAAATASGAPLQSGINVPTNTGGVFGENPSSTCTDEMSSTTVAAVPTTSAAYSNGTEPCGCGTVTVTVTGPPSAGVTTLVSSAAPAVSTSAAVVPPAVSSAYSSAPYPLTSGGLITDTMPAPSVPFPTGTATGGYPAGNATATTTASPSQFTGAAAPSKAAGALFGLVAGAAMLVL